MLASVVGFGLLFGAGISLLHELLTPKFSYDRAFIDGCRNLNLYVKVGKEIALPCVNQSLQFDWGTRLIVQLPIGLSSESIIDNKYALAEALRVTPDACFVRYEDGLIVDVVTAAFPTMVPYRASNNEGNYRVFIGVNQRNEAQYYDFAGKFPHLLIGGISGGGKSVIVRNIITQLVTGPSPDLYLSDLKGGVELGLFKGLACVKAFATELPEVLSAVISLENEMKRRYAIMSGNGSQEWHGKRAIFVVDELADFKSRAGDPLSKLKNEIKSVITRLSAKGRAAGVILLLATQRPSADIVEGVIKTNIAASICFRTRDNVQSRIVLDHGAAADLPDIPGRFIYQTARDETLQAPFISADEVRNIVRGLPQRPISVNTNASRKEVTQNESHKQSDYSEIGTLDGNIIEL